MNTVNTLETTGQDWANFLSHETSGNGMIYLIALLSGKPDAATLRGAAADLIGLQPVLGCRFDETQAPPVWAPVEGDAFFREAHAGSVTEGLDEIVRNIPALCRPMDVTLLTTPDQSAICLRFDHAATDGGGAKRCLQLLSRLDQWRHRGQEPARSPSADRSDAQVYARCGIPDYRMALKREAPSTEPVTTFPYSGMNGQTVRYCWTSLPLSAVKRPGSTVNDRLLAAYGFALSKACAEARAIAIHMTVDLRRYLGEETLPYAANLSGMASVSVPIGPEASYSRTLEAVQSQTALLKAGHAGLSSAAMMTYLRSLPYAKAKGTLLDAERKSRASGAAAPILSNLGFISQDALKFGDSTVEGILPVLRAPAFMLGASGYRDTLTLSAGVYSEERQEANMEAFLHDIREILLRPL